MAAATGRVQRPLSSAPSASPGLWLPWAPTAPAAGRRKPRHAALDEQPFNFDKNEVQNRGQFSFLPICKDLCRSDAWPVRGGGQAGWLRVLGHAPAPGRATGHRGSPRAWLGTAGQDQLTAGLAGVKRGACEAGEKRRAGEAAWEPERARQGMAGLPQHRRGGRRSVRAAGRCAEGSFGLAGFLFSINTNR